MRRMNATLLVALPLAGCALPTSQQDEQAITSPESAQRCAQLQAMNGRPWSFESCLVDWTTFGARLRQMGSGYCDTPPAMLGAGLEHWEQLVDAGEPAALYHWRELSGQGGGEVFIVHHLGEPTTTLSFYGADGDDLLLEGTWQTQRWFYPPAWLEIEWTSFVDCREPDGPY